MANQKDAYYFSHDSNALTDPKILAMRCDYGMEGYGLYWAIIEMMRNESTYKLSLNKNTYRAIKMQTNVSFDVEEFINNCINEYVGDNGKGLFVSDSEHFWSDSFLERMTKYESLKEKRKAAGLKGLEKRWGKQEVKKNNKRILSIAKFSKSIANAINFNSKCNSKSIANAIKKHSKPIAKNGKLNEIKLNKIKYILDYTKLDLLFNYLIYREEENFESLNAVDRTSICSILKNLEILVTIPAVQYLSEDKLLDLKLQYWTITELYINPDKIYLNKLSNSNFMFKFLKAKKYKTIEKEEDLSQFVGYFITCLREVMQENKEEI